MRKAQKRQIEDFLKLLEQAHIQIREMIENKNTDMVLKLLEECQNGAISVGTLIESSEGEGVQTIPLLESYCEQIYQCYERLTGGEQGNANKIYKTLKQSLLQVGSSIRNDIKISKVVVFLPYKASMWDSLESVWKAADADPECEAYVVPIPYFDRNPDGSFREEHYEGDLYPDYVPITRYDKFDLEKIHPDTIYIHNPYDDCNYVTSVHPDFYSKKLKQYTDELVYIPYFILAEVDPEDEEAVKGIAHFCTVPGVVYADKVIVQSEEMRKVYIKVLTNWLGAKQAKELKIKDKILGLGSPKVDKVLNTKKEDIHIPEEWLKIIQKPDGSRKKIIFYNTSVGALLQHDERMLEKMQDVFRIFKEYQNEVALLWRPHPLIQATIESMRPQLWKEYERLVRQYQEDGWGIYDASSDLNRAIALCDGYYGDQSSVVQLCRKAGICAMIQNVECR